MLDKQKLLCIMTPNSKQNTDTTIKQLRINKMKIEQIKATTEIKTNIEVGSTVAREIDTSQLYKVVYITVDFKAVLVSKNSSDASAIIDLLSLSGWVKVLGFRFNEIPPID